jgi:hypothetical protein
MKRARNKKPAIKPRPTKNNDPDSHIQQLAYTADEGARHKRYIDVEASLKKLGLTREQLMSRTWPRGSPQHRLKGAASRDRYAAEQNEVRNGA